jgi:cysteine desulfurase
MFSAFNKLIKKQHPLKGYVKKYFDYASQTPTDKRVLKVVEEYSKTLFYNPGSLYANGVFSAKALKDSRKKIACLLSDKSLNSVHENEIIFTSGGTESNNIALQGVVDKWYESKKYDYTEKPHVIISEIEHPALYNVVENLKKQHKITFSKIKINNDGLIDLQELKNELAENKNTVLVSIMLVNNEIGSIQPVRDITSFIRKARGDGVYPLFHTDACQALNYIDMSFDKMGADLVSYDASKFYGPKGVGILYIKRNTPINPVYFGGDQEYGMRPGTENLPSVMGMVKALEIVVDEKQKEIKRLYKLQQYIFAKVDKIKGVSINGSTLQEKRIVNNINICFPGKDSEFLLFKMDKMGYEVSTGTTCQNKKEDSRSISVEALGGDCAGSSLRISLGRYTTKGQVRGLIKALGMV